MAAEDAQQKLSDSLNAIKDAQAAIASNFQDLAGEALAKLRRSLSACDRDAPKALNVLSNDVMLDVFQFLIKSAEKKGRKAQVVECLACLVVKAPWAIAAASSPEICRSLETLLEGQANLLQALASPVTEPEVEVDVDSKTPKELTTEDLERIKKQLNNALENFIAAGWVYPRHSDKAITGFRSLYSATSHLDGVSRSSADAALAIFRNEWSNLLGFLKSLHEGRSSQRQQIQYVVERISPLAPKFQSLLEAQPTSPWQFSLAATSESRQSQIESSKDEAASRLSRPLVTEVTEEMRASVRRSCKNPHDTTWVLIVIGDMALNVTEADDVEVVRFRDNTSKDSTSIHIDVITHILTMILKQVTKQVVSVFVESPARHPHMFQDIRNLFEVRRLMIPKFVTCEQRGKQGFQAGVAIAASDKDALKLIRKEVEVSKRAIMSDLD